MHSANPRRHHHAAPYQTIVYVSVRITLLTMFIHIVLVMRAILFAILIVDCVVFIIIRIVSITSCTSISCMSVIRRRLNFIIRIRSAILIDILISMITSISRIIIMGRRLLIVISDTIFDGALVLLVLFIERITIAISRITLITSMTGITVRCLRNHIVRIVVNQLLD